MQVGDGITIPVYTDGILVECSILAEHDAACLMTGAYTEGVNRMNPKAKSELDKIVAGDPTLQAQVDELAQHVDSINASTEGLIRREGEEAAVPVVETPAEAAPAEVPAPVTEPPAPAELELTEDAMQALAERVAGQITAQMAERLQTVETNATQALAALTEQFTAMSERITKLESPMAEAVAQAIKDMPRNLSTKLVYRPTQRAQAEQPEADVTSEEIAQATLANLK
jgi:hypothetical protein